MLGHLKIVVQATNTSRISSQKLISRQLYTVIDYVLKKSVPFGHVHS